MILPTGQKTLCSRWDTTLNKQSSRRRVHIHMSHYPAGDVSFGMILLLSSIGIKEVPPICSPQKNIQLSWAGILTGISYVVSREWWSQAEQNYGVSSPLYLSHSQHSIVFRDMLWDFNQSWHLTSDRNVSYHQILKINRINCDFQLPSPLAQELPVSFCQCFNREEVTNIVYWNEKFQNFQIQIGTTHASPANIRIGTFDERCACVLEVITDSHCINSKLLCLTENH